MDIDTLTIRPVAPGAPEVALIHTLRADCAADLGARFGPGHWAQIARPGRVNDEARCKSLFAVMQGGSVVATLALTRQPPRFFNLKLFARPHDQAAYLSSLAV